MDNKISYVVELPPDNIYESKCPIIYALDIVGQK